MNNNIATLCIILDDVHAQGDWTSIGYPVVRPRSLRACLMNMYQYSSDYKCVPIDDWAKAKQEFAINYGIEMVFSELAELLLALVPDEQGMFIYSGDVPPPIYANILPTSSDIQLHPKAKTCQSSPYPQYAASYAPSIAGLKGFDPDPCPCCHFNLAWLGSDDLVLHKFLQRWDDWPDSTCQAMLPRGPFPSDRSVELSLIGDESNAIGLFVSDSHGLDLSDNRLRNILGENAIITRLDGVSFWEWLERGCFTENLLPVDRELPFQR